MPLLLLGLFICVPLAEIAVFVLVGRTIDIIPTILIVIVTAVLGTWLLQRQGLSAFIRTQEALAAGKVPIESLVDGVYLLVAGAFLLTPGFITDTIGFLLFIPPVRRWLAKFAFQRIAGKIDIKVSGTSTGTHPPPPGTGNDGAGPVIDGEFERIDPENGTPRSPGPKGSPWRSGPSGKPRN